ncbi:PTS glucose transporter subunit IIA [Enterococcus gilvus]|uniref:PTS sugar transporter subunit IIA n=1 Tax=Enterococcus gilvus TaxID=160453 RepID=UPI003D6B3A8A
MLFGKKKGIFAPVDGTFVPLAEVNDPVFAQKMMGDGVAVIPDSDEITSPVIGTIQTIIEQKHALGIIMEGGQEVLVHMGIDTVELAGEPFDILVKVGDRVEIGTPLARMKRQETVVLVIAAGEQLSSSKFTTRTMVERGAELAKV